MCAWTSTAAIPGRPPRRKPGDEDEAARGRTAVSDDPTRDAARAATAARPTCSGAGGWMPMREYPRRRGGRFRHRRHRRRRRHARLPARRDGLLGRRARCRPLLAAARGFRLRREPSRPSSTGPTSASSTARTRCSSAPTTRGKSVGGSDRAFRHGVAALPAGMVQVAQRCSATAPTGRSIGARCGATTREVEQALKISGPVTYPWGPKRPRYPYRAARAERRRRWCWREGARRSASTGRRRRSPRSRRRAACRRPASIAASASLGCSTNAKQSALITWLPRALAAGAEIRDLAMVGRIETDARRPRHRRALSSRGALAVPARAQRRRRRLCDRDAAAAAELGERALSRTASPTARAWSAGT